MQPQKNKTPYHFYLDNDKNDKSYLMFFITGLKLHIDVKNIFEILKQLRIYHNCYMDMTNDMKNLFGCLELSIETDI